MKEFPTFNFMIIYDRTFLCAEFACCCAVMCMTYIMETLALMAVHRTPS